MVHKKNQMNLYNKLLLKHRIQRKKQLNRLTELKTFLGGITEVQGCGKTVLARVLVNDW